MKEETRKQIIELLRKWNSEGGPEFFTGKGIVLILKVLLEKEGL